MRWHEWQVSVNVNKGQGRIFFGGGRFHFAKGSLGSRFYNAKPATRAGVGRKGIEIPRR